jgi:predicted site-specific integrase-resolvase
MLDLSRPSQPILTDDDLALTLGFSRRKLRAWVRGGALPFKEVNGIYLFETEKVRQRLGIKLKTECLKIDLDSPPSGFLG